MMISRTARGSEDKNLFLVYADPDHTEKLSAKNLAIFCGHETLHALLWDMSEKAAQNDPDSSHTEDMIENTTYQLQRVIFGEIEH